MQLKVNYVEGDWDFNQLYSSGEWEPGTHKILQDNIADGDLFVDVGAWYGPVTLWALELGAKVIAFEPDPHARQALIKNTKGLCVEVLAQAWAKQNGLALLENPRNDFGNSMSRLARHIDRAYGDPLVTFPPAAPRVPVDCWTPRFAIHHIKTRYNRYPDFIKLDIEGGEVEILPDLVPACSEHGVKLLVSWHEPWWDRPYPQEEREAWFDGMECTGDWVNWGQLLAVPK